MILSNYYILLVSINVNNIVTVINRHKNLGKFGSTIFDFWSFMLRVTKCKKPNMQLPGPGHQFEPQLWPALPLLMNGLSWQQSLVLFCLSVSYINDHEWCITILLGQNQLYSWVQCLHWIGLVISQYLLKYCLGRMQREELSSHTVEECGIHVIKAN